MKVLFVTNIPSPYRVDFFNELGKHCELTVLFERKASDERDISWEDYNFECFSGVFMNGKSVSVDMSYCSEVINYVKSEVWDFIICSDFLSPTGMKLTSYLKRHKIPYALESDGGFAGRDNPIKKIIKTRAIKGASWYFSTGESHDNYYASYGADRDSIIRYPFSSVRKKDILEKPLAENEKKLLKAELGVFEEFAVLAVGQFIHRKGFDILIKAAREFEGNVGICFVGGNPTEEYMSLKEQYHLNNIHFVGFKKPLELKKYYLASDLFVLPTREDIWGLVINEAFANGLPVITTNRCLAGMEMIENGKNGFIVPTENADAICDAVNKLRKDTHLCHQMAENNIKKAHRFTIESMAESHIDFFKNI